MVSAHDNFSIAEQRTSRSNDNASRFIHISPSCWTIFRSFEIVLETGTVDWIGLQMQCSTPGLHNSESSKGQITSTWICRGPQMSISFWRGNFVVAWKKAWNDNYLLEVELLQHLLQLRKLSRAAYVVQGCFTYHGSTTFSKLRASCEPIGAKGY